MKYPYLILLRSGLAMGFRDVPLGAELPFLSCGIYEAQGVLSRNNRGEYVLMLKPMSFSREEIILLGGSEISKKSYDSTPVIARFDVFKPIQGRVAPFAYLQKLKAPSVKDYESYWIRKMYSKPCRGL